MVPDETSLIMRYPSIAISTGTLPYGCLPLSARHTNFRWFGLGSYPPRSYDCVDGPDHTQLSWVRQSAEYSLRASPQHSSFHQHYSPVDQPPVFPAPAATVSFGLPTGSMCGRTTSASTRTKGGRILSS